MSRMERYHGNDVNQEIPVSPRTPEPSKKQRKKKSKLGLLFKLLLLLIICGAVFGIIDYRKGYKEAKNDEMTYHLDVQDFQGSKNKEGAIDVLILGSDSRGEDMGRADSIMLARYDKKSHQPKIISFMRDTYVEIPGVGWNKINAAYAYGGPELVRQTLEHNFGLTAEYYAVISFETFPKIIDTLSPSGIEMDVEKDMTVDDLSLTAGKQHLNGAQALAYARFRKDEEGDFGRVRRQQQVMNALVTQGLSLKNILNLPETAGRIMGYTSTNISPSIFPGIMSDFVLNRSQSLEKLSVPVKDSWWDGYYDEAGSVLEIDYEMNKQAINEFLN